MQQISDWLKQLDMSEYAQRFADNDIDIDVLNELTDQDFDRLGVSLGHRRRMLRAIRELSALPIAAVTERETSAPTAPEQAPKDTAERRQVTVMFSDVVGSTALAGRMDPEDLREVISGYQKCVAQTVQRFGGFVAKYMGDGVLVYFGYPQAHEDDAERAVRAGLELVRPLVARSGHRLRRVLRHRQYPHHAVDRTHKSPRTLGASRKPCRGAVKLAGRCGRQASSRDPRTSTSASASGSSPWHFRGRIERSNVQSVTGHIKSSAEIENVTWYCEVVQFPKRIRVYSAAGRRKRCVCAYLGCRESGAQQS